MTRQIAFEPLPASVLLNEFAALKRFAGFDVGGDFGAVGMALRACLCGVCDESGRPMKKHQLFLLLSLSSLPLARLL